MKSLPLSLGLVLTALAAGGAAFGQHAGHAPQAAPATAASSGLGRPLPPGWEPAVNDSATHWAVFLQRAEFRSGEMADAAVLDAEGWVGGDYQRFWWRLEGEQLTERARPGELEFQALYSRIVSPFWDVQAGLRVDRTYSGPERSMRGHVVLGLEGLAPYRFEVEPILALSDEGNISFEFVTTYELFVTQRLALQPRLALRLDTADEDYDQGLLGEGLNDLDLGLRLRYDISRQFSPYVGVEWHRPLGASAGAARQAGHPGWRSSLVIGVRGWF